MSDEALSDSEAVRRLQHGDEAALRTLYDRYLDRVFRFAVGLVRQPEEAEEIVEEAFLQAFRCARDYRGDGAFSGWLFRIARNLCMDRLRRGRGLRLLSLEGLEGEWERGEGEEDREPLLRLAVQEALSQLATDHRVVLMMRDVEGLTNREAAEAMGRSASATKSLHFRARQALRDALANALGMEEE